MLPVPIHEVVYEKLVEDFELGARGLVATCGLEWEPACLRNEQGAFLLIARKQGHVARKSPKPVMSGSWAPTAP